MKDVNVSIGHVDERTNFCVGVWELSLSASMQSMSRVTSLRPADPNGVVVEFVVDLTKATIFWQGRTKGLF